MRTRLAWTLSLLLAVVVMSLAVAAQGADAWIGTWKLNLAKSTFSPANLAPKSQTIKQEAMGAGFKATVDGADAQGKPIHQETMSMFDGKSSEVKGAPDANTTRVYKRIDARSYEYVQSTAGKVTVTARTVVSADGKTRTITTTGTNAQGVKVNNVAVYDRQ